MDIMAMDMANKINRFVSLLFLFLSTSIVAEEWSFKPEISGTETYSDNIRLLYNNPEESFVTELAAGLNASYLSKRAKVNFFGNKSYLNYSHDSELNNDYRTLTTDGEISLWDKGPVLFGTATIDNISRNEAANSIGDIITGDTVESQRYSTGIRYNTGNSQYSLNTSIIYDSVNNEDDLANSYGYKGSIYAQNEAAARNVFWQITANYEKREDGVDSNPVFQYYGENYIVDAKIGMITDFSLNPFVRYYDEDVKGSATQEVNSTASLGTGLRWLATPHLILDVSYNFVEDETVSDDYIAANIKWSPSERTSLQADFNQRFFGKSYFLDFSHRTRRLTNKVSYSEELSIFDRGNYEQINNQFWCPADQESPAADDCFPSDTPPNDIDDYEIVNFSSLQVTQSNQYSLNKRLALSSTLKLSRTSFGFNISTNEREYLETGNLDDYFDSSLTIDRKISPLSNIKLYATFRHTIYNKNQINTGYQEDYYRTYSGSYSRRLASKLSGSFTLRYINRSSTVQVYSYDETRATLNITKDF